MAYGDSLPADSGASTSATVTINKPAATANGHYVILAFTLAAARTVSAVPSGFSLLATDGANRVYVYGKVASGEPASWSFTISSATKWAACALVDTSPDPTTPVDVVGAFGSSGGSTNCVAPSVTTTVPNVTIYGIFGAAGTGAWGNDPGMTERTDSQSSGVTSATQEGATEVIPSAGATGTRTATQGSAVANFAVLIGIRTAPVSAASLLMAFP